MSASVSDGDSSNTDSEGRTKAMITLLELEVKCVECVDYIECYSVRPSDVTA